MAQAIHWQFHNYKICLPLKDRSGRRSNAYLLSSDGSPRLTSHEASGILRINHRLIPESHVFLIKKS